MTLTSAFPFRAITLPTLALLLAACGGGGGDGSVVELRGTLSIPPYHTVDTSLNDPRAPFLSNRDFADAQRLGNPVVVGGFVTAEPTGRLDDRFRSEPDPFDTYRVRLTAGQRATLYIADFQAGRNEVDLVLWRADGWSGQALPELADASIGAVPVQQVRAPDNGEFFLDVQAALGTSKYVLTIGSSIQSLQEMGYPEPIRPHRPMVANQVLLQLHQESTDIGTNRHDISSSTLFARQLVDTPGLSILGGDAERGFLLSLDSGRTAGDVLNPLSLGNDRRTPGADHERHLRNPAMDLAVGLTRHPAVRQATPNYVYQLQNLPDDRLYPLQWHYPMVSLPSAWGITTGSPNVVVAVLDSGVFLSHPDLSDQLTTNGMQGDGWNFVAWPSGTTGPNPMDPGDGPLPGSSSWHGTLVAGIVGAATNNSIGIAGAGRDIAVMPVRVCGQGGACTLYDVVQGVRYAAGLPNDSGTLPSRPADVINLSLGGPAASDMTAALYRQICDAGILVVAAAGNTSSSEPVYPASYPCVISVAALDARARRAPYSSFGPHIDLAAPGGDMRVDTTADGYPDGILSTHVNDIAGIPQASYEFRQGTSMAAPHVSGILGLMRSLNPTITADVFQQWLAQGLLTDRVGEMGNAIRTNQHGYGLINALKAVQQAGQDPTPLILVSPGQLQFGAFTGPREVDVSAIGGQVRITGADGNRSWIQVTPTQVDDHGLGTYRVSVDTADLMPGAYSGEVIFRSEDAPSAAIGIGLLIEAPDQAQPEDAGPHYILLLDPDTFETRAQAEVRAADGQYRFSLRAEPGQYYVLAGSDLDNDGRICTTGEACGAYVNLDQLTLIELKPGEIQHIGFVTGFRSGVENQGLEAVTQKLPQRSRR
ncbi:S8 family serine peptidase [Ectothiorhodospira shaposhnikovii]|uniref:S8 family serine peptidase n=1 Tax=Ectothiorhodospira shaposhnikovii TaxID=1054 RepID=UPI00190544BE|nr:S8 family serine peptidase [Ectothiorhodospira shaposhnikovii]